MELLSFYVLKSKRPDCFMVLGPEEQDVEAEEESLNSFNYF